MAILEQEDVEGVDAERGRQLTALGQIIDLWMMRDVRFVVVPRTRSDFRRLPSDVRMRQRERTFERIESALTFQLGDWEDTSGRFAGGRSLTSAAHDVIGAASTLDALMLRSAWDCAVDVFLTSDLKLLNACSHAAAPFPLISSPSGLADRLAMLGTDPMFIGMVDHEDCRWDFGFLLGDTGKWVTLFEAMSI